MSLLRKVGEKTIFFLIYAVAILVSFLFIGSAFVFVTKLKLESIAVLVTAVIIGGLTPLAAANYSIEGWKKRRDLGESREKLNIKLVISSFFELIAIFASMFVTAGFTAGMALTLRDYAPILLGLPPVIIGLPALVAGIITYVVLRAMKDVILAKVFR